MLRDPTRDDMRIHEHESSRVVLETAVSGRKVEICVAEQVEREFHKNVEAVQDEAECKLKALKRTIEKLDDF